MLPGIQVKSTSQAIDELKSQKKTVTQPIYLSDYFDMASGCTLVENGKPKVSQKKMVYKFESTGKERMNKTDYFQKVEADKISRAQKMKDSLYS